MYIGRWSHGRCKICGGVYIERKREVFWNERGIHTRAVYKSVGLARAQRVWGLKVRKKGWLAKPLGKYLVDECNFFRFFFMPSHSRTFSFFLSFSGETRRLKSWNSQSRGGASREKEEVNFAQLGRMHACWLKPEAPRSHNLGEEHLASSRFQGKWGKE